MKNWKILFLLASLSLFGFTSCEDNTEESETMQWKDENIAYIDSIASVARGDVSDSWRVILDTGLDENKKWGNEYYLYCEVMKKGGGSVHPEFSDSVSVNYKGSLINGFVFDSNYEGELEPDFDVPVKMLLSETVPGFYGAVQQMVEGDIWRVYIPAYLGYGVHEQSGIPANSTLIFDINLVSFQ